MASKVKVAVKEKKEEATPEKDAPDTPDTPLPLLDLSDAAVRKMIKAAKKRGYVTHDQVNAVLPSEEVTSDQIEDVFAMLSEMGINVIENEEAETEDSPEEGKEEAEEDDTDSELVDTSNRATPAETKKSEPGERTDDPVRMYLREMGSVELLSREGEIAIAKRIEAGREAMIAGLCESPLTFRAIIVWRDELNEGKVLLRDIIDLDATYAGPDAKPLPAPPISPDGQIMVPDQLPTLNTASIATPFKPADKRTDSDETPAESAINESDLDDDEDKENWLSVAAVEAELKPKVIESFETIADSYKRLRRLQDQDIQLQLSRLSLSPAQVRKYKTLKNEIIGAVKSLRLNRARIEALIEQLYDINKRLVGYEGRMLRLAESHGVAREDF